MPVEKRTYTIMAAHICGPSQWSEEMFISFDKGEHESNELIVSEIIELLNEYDFRDCQFKLKETE